MGLNEFLKSKRLYMLFLLPFIALALAFFSNILQNIPDSPLLSAGIINLPFLSGLDGQGMIIINVSIILCLAYLLFYINERYKVVGQTTTLPSLIYVLLTSVLVGHLGLSNLLVAIICVVFAISRLQSAINNTKSGRAVFDFGLYICITVLLAPKLVLLILWSVSVLLFSGRSTLKDIMALLFGLLTPLVFTAFYYFWIDRLPELPELFINEVFAGEFIRDIPSMEYVRLGILGLILLLSLSNIMNYYPVSVVNQRRGILSMVSLLVFLGLTMFIIPGNFYDFMYLLALPLSFIYTQYFVTHRVRVVGNILFLLLLATCFL